MSFAINLIAAKHAKNMQRFPPEKEAEFHQKKELAQAAAFTLTGDPRYYPNTWSKWYFDKAISEDDDIENHVNTCALLCAEIERVAKERGLITAAQQNDPWKVIEVPGKGSVLFLKDRDSNGFFIKIISTIPEIAPGATLYFGHSEVARDEEFFTIDAAYAENIIAGWESLLK